MYTIQAYRKFLLLENDIGWYINVAMLFQWILIETVPSNHVSIGIDHNCSDTKLIHLYLVYGRGGANIFDNIIMLVFIALHCIVLSFSHKIVSGSGYYFKTIIIILASVSCLILFHCLSLINEALKQRLQ